MGTAHDSYLLDIDGVHATVTQHGLHCCFTWSKTTYSTLLTDEAVFTEEGIFNVYDFIFSH